MAYTIRLYRSSTATTVPNAANMQVGELAINTADKRLWSKHGTSLIELTDHDALTNFVANEHIDWTSTSSNLSTTGTVTALRLQSNEWRGNPGTANQLIANAGESYSYATGQTGEFLYVNAESGLQINSSPDNWTTGWAGRNTATICDTSGNSSLPGTLNVTGAISGPNVTSGSDPGHTHTAYSTTGHTHSTLTFNNSGSGGASGSTYNGGSTLTVSYNTIGAASSGHNHSGTYQPLDGDLTAIAGLAGTSGLARKTAADTWTLDTATYLTGNQTITLSGDVTGSGTTAITTVVADDSHSHTGATISALDASDTTTGVFASDRIVNISVPDTRAVDDTTSAYGKQVRFDFKTRTTVSAPGNDTYVGVAYVAPWSDVSGGPKYQLAFTNTTNVPFLAIRAGDTGGAWGSWYNMWNSADFSQPLELTGGTVTGAVIFSASAGPTISSTQPDIFLEDTDAAANEISTIIRQNSGILRISSATDAAKTTPVNDVFYANRAGTTWDQCTLEATTIDLTGNVDISNGLDVTGAVAATGTVTGSNLSGTNTGDQTITLTGDVTGSGTGSFVTAIAANTIGTTELNATGTPSASTYLRGDMSWQTISSGGVTSVAAGNGMDFTTITATGSVVMGLPGTLTASTSNGVTATSHTHAITTSGTGTIMASSGATLSGAFNCADNDVNRPTLEDYGVKHQTLTITANAATFNCTLGNSGYMDLQNATGTVTMTFSNPSPSGTYCEFVLHVQQGSTARSITWPAAVDWRGTTPSLSTTDNDIDIFHFCTYNGGTNWYGSFSVETGGLSANQILVTTSTTASDYKVPFANTTGSTTGQYGLLQDSTATFTYNPSTNTLTVGVVNATSDERLKENISEYIAVPLGFKAKQYDMGPLKGKVGYVAQDVLESLPAAVTSDENGMLSLDYNMVLVAKIAELEARLAKLEQSGG